MRIDEVGQGIAGEIHGQVVGARGYPTGAVPLTEVGLQFSVSVFPLLVATTIQEQGTVTVELDLIESVRSLRESQIILGKNVKDLRALDIGEISQVVERSRELLYRLEEGEARVDLFEKGTTRDFDFVIGFEHQVRAEIDRGQFFDRFVSYVRKFEVLVRGMQAAVSGREQVRRVAALVFDEDRTGYGTRGRERREKESASTGKFALESIAPHRHGILPAYVHEGKAQSSEEVQGLGERRRLVLAILGDVQELFQPVESYELAVRGRTEKSPTLLRTSGFLWHSMESGDILISTADILISTAA